MWDWRLLIYYLVYRNTRDVEILDKVSCINNNHNISVYNCINENIWISNRKVTPRFLENGNAILHLANRSCVLKIFRYLGKCKYYNVNWLKAGNLIIYIIVLILNNFTGTIDWKETSNAYYRLVDNFEF